MENTQSTDTDFNKLSNFISLITDNFRTILIVSGLFFFGSILYALTLPNIYSSTVTILPQNTTNSKLGSISTLASFAGIDINSKSDNYEAFYNDILKSNYILEKLIQKEWVVDSSGTKMSLIDFFEIEVENIARKHDILKTKLKKEVIYFTKSNDNNIMRLTVMLPNNANLASNLANFLVLELERFTLEYSQKKNTSVLQSVKKQLDVAKRELVMAEEKMLQFKQRNVNFSQSVDLLVEFERLNRELLTESAVYTELRKQFEISKIELEKNKEELIILDAAIPAAKKTKPSRSFIVIFMSLLGFIASLIFIMMKKFLVEYKLVGLK